MVKEENKEEINTCCTHVFYKWKTFKGQDDYNFEKENLE